MVQVSNSDMELLLRYVSTTEEMLRRETGKSLRFHNLVRMTNIACRKLAKRLESDQRAKAAERDFSRP